MCNFIFRAAVAVVAVLAIITPPLDAADPPPGCASAIIVDCEHLPWTDYSQTTCGHGNNYDETCLGYYDGGEDIIYELQVPYPMSLEITLDPKGTTWTGLAVADECPPGTECLAISTSSAGQPHGPGVIHFDAGTYYVMVDTWPSPECIANFDLSIYPSPYYVECPPDGIDEAEPCGDYLNNGCDDGSGSFMSIPTDDTVCGTLWADGGLRDADWYKIEVYAYSIVTFNAFAMFDMRIGRPAMAVEGSMLCEDYTGNLSPGVDVEAFHVAEFIDTLYPGEYLFVVRPEATDGMPCNDWPWEYVTWIDCLPLWPWDWPAAGGCDEYISRVQVGDINNTSLCEGYSDFTDSSTVMHIGSSYPITITSGNAYSGDDCAVWIDWYQDLYLDETDRVSMDVETGVGPYTGTITPPELAALGPTRMRLRLSFTGTAAEMSPYGITTYGEVEDYTVIILPPADVMLLEPDPVLAIYAFAVDPMSGMIFIGDDFDLTHSAGDIDVSSLMINGSFPPATVTLTVHPDLAGEVLAVSFPIAEFIGTYPLLWDSTDQIYTVSGDFAAGGDFSVNATATFMGHRSGDLNCDGSVDIADLVMVVDWMFTAGSEPVVIETADVDGSGGIPDVADLVYLVDYIFSGGAAPRHP